jgi:hypothetical protein
MQNVFWARQVGSRSCLPYDDSHFDIYSLGKDIWVCTSSRPIKPRRRVARRMGGARSDTHQLHFVGMGFRKAHNLSYVLIGGWSFQAKLARHARRDREIMSIRHCEERKRRSNPLFPCCCSMDCFAEPVIGRALARPVGSQ